MSSYHFGIPFLESLAFRLFMTERILCTEELLFLHLERLECTRDGASRTTTISYQYISTHI